MEAKKFEPFLDCNSLIQLLVYQSLLGVFDNYRDRITRWNVTNIEFCRFLASHKIFVKFVLLGFFSWYKGPQGPLMFLYGMVVLTSLRDYYGRWVNIRRVMQNCLALTQYKYGVNCMGVLIGPNTICRFDCQ